MRVVPITTLRLHPEAKRVPPMNAAQAAEFQTDIAERGIRVPIEVLDFRQRRDIAARRPAAQLLDSRISARFRDPDV